MSKQPYRDGQFEFRRQAAEAQARGEQKIRETRAALKNDSASSANRKAAAAAATAHNSDAIEALKAGGGLGFNPLAKKR